VALAAGGVAPSTLAAPPSPRAVVGPAGFTDTPVTTVSQPTTVTSLPDGRVIVLEKGGAARVINEGVLVPAPAITLSVCSNSERGLLGFAADPDFGATGAVYLFYTTNASGSCQNRVSKFVMTGNTIDPASEQILLDNIGSTNGNHNGGDLEVGNDGYLYVAVGDAGCNPRNCSQSAGGNPAAQDLSLLNGKILRVDRFTGFAPPSNPLVGDPAAVDCRVRGNNAGTPTTPCKELFAWGLRNPYRFAFDTNTGATRFYINDVGQNKREEVNEGLLGANYGWPEREGRCAQTYVGSGALCPGPSPTSGYTQPITDYSHDDGLPLEFGGEYVTGGSFVPNGAWPAQYDGGYVFGDGSPGRMFVKPASGSTNYASPFATGVPGITDLNFVLESAGWALYYTQIDGTVGKITYNAPAATLPGPQSYQPLTTSERAFDTRNAGPDTGPIRGGTSRLVKLNPPAGATAALVNVTYVRPRGGGYVANWIPRTPRPFTATTNSPNAAVVANSAVLPLAADGTVITMVSATGDVVMDIQGFYFEAPAAVAAGRFVPGTSSRVFDTRDPASATNPYEETVGGSETIVRTTASIAGVPSTASSVVLSVTALAGPTSGGFVVALPFGGTAPPTANVNAVANDRRTNLVVVPVGTSGRVEFRLSSGIADVVVDLFGVITNNSAPAATTGRFAPVVANREVDTRTPKGFGPLAANTVGVVNPSVVPDNAAGVVQNVTVTRTEGAGFITTYANGATVPFVSNGNVTGPNQTRGVLSFTALGAGSVAYRPSMGTNVVTDVFGYFTP
jgi:glucose/arabinose dehydrogenase